MPDLTLRLALLQFAPVLGELRANLGRVLDGMRQAAAAGAGLLIAPEMCLTGWTLPDQQLRARLAAQTARLALPALSEAARQHAMTVVVGGPLPAADGTANCAIALTPAGGRAVHRKLHLFGPEASWWSPGERIEVVAADGLVVGPLICYDGEFCEVPRMLRLAGATILAVSASNMAPYERDQDVIFAARALENECVVAVCNRVGGEGGWRYFGRSLVADARGNLVAQAGRGEELLVADVTTTGAADPALGYMVHRRPGIYRAVCRPGRAAAAAAARLPRPLAGSPPRDGRDGAVALQKEVRT
jgi:predicted amidohydrolase